MTIKMNGDLSLSQALGGLRIANPDDGFDAVSDASGYGDSIAASASEPKTIPNPVVNEQHAVGTASRPCEASANSGFGRPSTFATAAAEDVHIRDPAPGTPHRHHQLEHNPPASGTGGRSTIQRRVSRGGSSGGARVESYIAHQTSQPYAGAASVPTTSQDWQDRGAAFGMKREIDANGRSVVKQIKKGVRDFVFGRVLGEGSYSTVYLATDRQTLKEYAIKVLEKRHIIKEKKIKYVNIEKNTLNRLTEHPGIVRLYYTFQDETSLYYVLDLCSGGELLGVLKKTTTFDVNCTRYYGAQILDAINYIHSRGIIHRDLKPENVLLDHQMHIKITDFGTAKLLFDTRDTRITENERRENIDPEAYPEDEERAASFVGTAEYVSPELLTHKNVCKASDLWAFGCIIYQLLAGRPPFKAGSEYLTFQKIVSLDYEFPPGFPFAARDLVERCLVLDPTMRLTIEHIKNHEFFNGQQFGRLLWRSQAPRLRPYVPPTQDTTIIQLTNLPSNLASTAGAQSQGPVEASPPNANNRPTRIITELPPPTQLDLEWSPVLTKNNERILKLGDLMVVSTPLSNTSHGKGSDDGHRKLSRFFGGNITKKRQRLVMVTSSGRILLAPVGGEEKRAKQELSLLSADASWRSHQDAKGQHVWCLDTGGYHFTFEELKAPSAGDGSRVSVNDWLESLDKAKDLAISQNVILETPFADVSSTVSSPSSTFGGLGSHPDGFGPGDRAARAHGSKSQGSLEESASKRNRFSKRQSRNGLGGPAF